MNIPAPAVKKSTTLIAQAGLTAKGVVYLFIGILALMAALHVGGQSSENADRTGALSVMHDTTLGKWMLPLLTLGLLCYSIWRFIEVAKCARNFKENWSKAVRYFLSGLVYLFVAYSAFRVISRSQKNGDSQQEFASELLSHKFGQLMLGAAAITIAGIGFYQVYYALSEKYKKHVQKMNLHTDASSLMLTAGKVGYIARGIVWLITSFLMLQAAITARSAKAGDTGKAFQFLEQSPLGPYLLGSVGIGLMAYGAFNFVRARFETFE